MQIYRPRRLMPAVICLTVSITGCSTVVEHEAWQAAKFPAASELRRVAVLPMEGDAEGNIKAELESVLTSVSYKDGPYFEVISRGELDRVLNEQALGLSAITDPATAAKVGKVLGVEGIYLGTVDQPSVSDQRYRENRSQCSQKNKKGKCLSYRNYSVTCTKRQAEIGLIPKLINVETAQVVYSKKLSRRTDSQACDDSSQAVVDGASLTREAVTAALDEFKGDVAPSRQKISITMLDDTNGLSSSTAEDQFEGALKFMDAGRSDRACKTFRDLENTGERTPDLLYNIAICSELEGDISSAIAYCRQADEAVFEPNEAINQCLDRMQKRSADEKILLGS